MLRKGLLVLLLVALVGVGSVFGEEGGAANAAALDIAPLFRGFALSESDLHLSGFGFGAYYERQMNDKWTLGAKMTFFTHKLNISVSGFGIEEKDTLFSLGILSRYYPNNMMDKFFFGFGVGFDRITFYESEFWPGGSDSFSQTFSGLNLHVNTGYRIFFNDNIFIEPLFGYKISKFGMLYNDEGLSGLSGFHIDLSIGYKF